MADDRYRQRGGDYYGLEEARGRRDSIFDRSGVDGEPGRSGARGRDEQRRYVGADRGDRAWSWYGERDEDRRRERARRGEAREWARHAGEQDELGRMARGSSMFAGGDWERRDRERGGHGSGSRHAADYGSWEGARHERASLDDLYRSWRDRQLAELDRDYEEYRQEREEEFQREFETWRGSRRAQQGGQAGASATAGSEPGSEQGDAAPADGLDLTQRADASEGGDAGDEQAAEKSGSSRSRGRSRS